MGRQYITALSQISSSIVAEANSSSIEGQPVAWASYVRVPNTLLDIAFREDTGAIYMRVNGRAWKEI